MSRLSYFNAGASPLPPLLLLLVLLLPLSWSKANAREREVNCLNSPPNILNVGAVIDFISRLGKEQKMAMEIAIQDVNRFSCSKLVLRFNNYGGNPAQALTAAVDLANSRQVQAVIGTKLNEGSLIPEIDKTSKNLPIISLTSTANPESQYFIQVANDISLHLNCIAAIVGQFRWRKVTAIYQHNNGLTSNSEILTYLSNSLRLVNSDIDEHVAFPSLSSLLDPEATIEEELKRLKNKSNRIFLIIQSSLEFGILLFEKANQMGIMEKGSVWIISDDVASHLDSADPSVYLNMQGVVGCKSSYVDTGDKFRQFKFKFRRKFGLKYPKEENPQPSIFALRAYDTIWSIHNAVMKSQGNFSLEELSENILSRNFEGLSGKISFKNRKLQESPTFKIVNVFGKGYKDVAHWSPIFGFSENHVKHEVPEIKTNFNGSASAVVLGPMNWPGGLQKVPRGWIYGNKEKPLKIGVPAKGACSELVSVSYDQSRNITRVTGFSINVFNAAVGRLPYHLHYDFVPFNGSYEELIEQVNSKVLDGAVGDIEIMAQRYLYVQFSHPYVDSGIAMVVRVKPDRSKEAWMFMETFTKEMWLLMVTMHLFIAFVVWIIEGEDNSEFKGFGAMLWFSVTILFFAHREPVKSNLARFVLAPWLFVIMIVSASFTASLTSMITVSHLEPSVPDIQILQRTNAIVGCNKRSFMVNYLIDELKFKPENIRRFESITDYPRAFENKEISAAFLTAPQAEVFLATYCKGYIQAGPTVKLGGLAFAFPKGSTLAIDISEAVLKAIECRQVQQLKEDMLSSTSCGTSKSNSKIQEEQLGPQPFFGLFLISGTTAIFGLILILLHFVRKKVHKLMSRIEATLFPRIRSMRSTLVAFPQTNNSGETFSNNNQTTISIELVPQTHLN